MERYRWVLFVLLLTVTLVASAQVPPYVRWVRLIEDIAIEEVAIDPDNNRYAVGSLDIIFDPLRFYLTKYSEPGDVLWTKQSTGSAPSDGRGVDTDALGNVFVTGYVTAHFLGGADTAFFDATAVVVSSGCSRFFIAKYDPGGTMQWLRQAGCVSSDFSIATTPDGYSYAVGTFRDSLEIGDTTLVSMASESAEPNDGFLVKYSPDGDFLWVRHFASLDSLASVTAHDVEIEPSGGCVVMGRRWGDAAAIGDSVFSRPVNGDFLASYGASGDFRWAIEPALTEFSVSDPPGDEISVDGAGNVYYAVDFWDVNLISQIVITAKYDSQGQQVWADSVTGVAVLVEVFVNDVVADSAGNSYLTGALNGLAVKFGDSTLSSQNGGLFIAARDPNGNYTGIVQGKGWGRALDIGVAGNLFVSGLANNGLEIGDLSFPFSGDRTFLAEFVNAPTAVLPHGRTPTGVSLMQNAPNPFNPGTTIRYELSRNLDIRIDVYDVAGRLVRTLADGPKSAGPHLAYWDGKTGQGVSAPSGVYFYRLRAGQSVLTRKMIMLK